MESTHDNLRFTAPLKILTAAVVGFILNLALPFGYHVLWPQVFAGTSDRIAALIALMAAIALFRFRRNVIEIIAACALIGLTIKTFL